MTVTVEETIDAPTERVWALLTDPDRWQDMISGIVSVDVLERPANGFVGLKWREKRIMFGKEATETMWITEAETNRFYETAAHTTGMIYTTRLSLDDADGKTRLRMQFSAKATTLGAKMMSVIAVLFNGAMKKALQQDLRDIKNAAENC